MSGPDLDRDLSGHLEPEVSPQRLARNRAAIHDRLRGRSGSVRWAFGGLALAAAAAVVVFLLWPDATPAPASSSHASLRSPGARIESAEGEATAELDDGTRIDLAPHTAVRSVTTSPRQVIVALERGRATFDVAHDPRREFRVQAGTAEVVVLGTRFDVQRVEGRVEVSVSRGRVRVERGDQRIELTVGDVWTSDDRATDAARADAVEPEDAIEGERPSQARRRRARRAEEPPPVEDPGSSARALFEAARQARLDGRPQGAAALLAELVQQHPRDPRAGLAAFELGRIRLDVLHDRPGGIAALEQALVLSPRASFRPDALARLASAYARAGRLSECREAQGRYLREYPDDPRADTVRSACE
ncbi:MAG: FecR domain-containing protein [Sandaracinaceae bacterium]